MLTPVILIMFQAVAMVVEAGFRAGTTISGDVATSTKAVAIGEMILRSEVNSLAELTGAVEMPTIRAIRMVERLPPVKVKVMAEFKIKTQLSR